MIDVKRFCSSEDYGIERLMHPWTLPDGRLAATDTRVAIMVDADQYDGPRDVPLRSGKVIKPPNVLEVVRGFENVAEWLPWPELPGCEECNGTGIVPEQECHECEGKGYQTCDMEHDHDCDECTGGTTINGLCLDCLDDEIEIGNRNVCLWQARRVATLPEVVFGLPSDDSQGMILFKFLGGCGGLMPLHESRKAVRHG